MKPRIELKEGQVFAPKSGERARHNHRRIIGIVSDRVFFSVGGGQEFLLPPHVVSCMAW